MHAWLHIPGCCTGYCTLHEVLPAAQQAARDTASCTLHAALEGVSKLRDEWFPGIRKNWIISYFNLISSWRAVFCRRVDWQLERVDHLRSYWRVDCRRIDCRRIDCRQVDFRRFDMVSFGMAQESTKSLRVLLQAWIHMSINYRSVLASNFIQHLFST